MKFTVDVDCTPEEARSFLGLPDMTRVHDLYIRSVTDAMSGQGNAEQVEQLFRTLSPFGDAGLKMLSSLMDLGIKATPGATASTKKKSD